jgi:hypothetical protein
MPPKKKKQRGPQPLTEAQRAERVCSICEVAVPLQGGRHGGAPRRQDLSPFARGPLLSLQGAFLLPRRSAFASVTRGAASGHYQTGGGLRPSARRPEER